MVFKSFLICSQVNVYFFGLVPFLYCIFKGNKQALKLCHKKHTSIFNYLSINLFTKENIQNIFIYILIRNVLTKTQLKGRLFLVISSFTAYGQPCCKLAHNFLQPIKASNKAIKQLLFNHQKSTEQIALQPRSTIAKIHVFNLNKAQQAINANPHDLPVELKR